MEGGKNFETYEQELIAMCTELEKKATDGIELLRAKCLKRGASGIKGLGRSVKLLTTLCSILALHVA